VEITITFNTKCNECGKSVLPGKASWSASTKAARHLSCGKRYDQKDIGNSVLQENVESNPKSVERKLVAELQCFVCGKKTGCNECEYLHTS
jgi:ribosomal protein L44E